MFPYPSGTGLHVGHPLGFIGTDVYGRYKRMAGRNVLYTMGFDAFGLPAEQYAVADRHSTRPSRRPQNVATYRRQLRRLGLSHDRRRSIDTTDPAYYRWTQWIFLPDLQLWYDPEQRPDGATAGRPISELVAEFDVGRPAHGRRPAVARPDDRRAGRRRSTTYRLAYVADAPVNWCPGLGTVVANEEVTADGRSDRGNFPVFKRNMRQWMMRITAYADRLIDDLDLLDWTDSIKTMQRNWIGRSQGARVDFDSPAGPITVFTTRPDTLFGATFMVLAPEHPLVADADRRRRWPPQVVAVPQAPGRGPRATSTRQDEDRQKTGVFTGSYATNPVNGQDDPGLDRRLRADGLRHRRDHGRAVRRPARLRVRPRVRPDDPGRSSSRRTSGSRRTASRRRSTRDAGRRRSSATRRTSTRSNAPRRPRRPDVGRRRHRHRSTPGWRPTASARRRSTTSCATGCSAASATGASRSRSSTTTTASPHALPDDMLPLELPDTDELLAAHVRPRRRVLRARRARSTGWTDWVERRARPRRRPAGRTAATPT